MLSLKNKIVFITGASSGIGKASAEQFAAQGAKLILTARRLERIEALAKDLRAQYGVEVLTIRLDVKDKMQVNDAVQNLPTDWKDIAILLNNAGMSLTNDKIQDGNIDNWDTIISTNLNGLLYVTRAILPGMIARNQGHIVNISSTAAHDYYPTGNVYCATKHAVRTLSKSLRLDLLGTDIRVSDVAPGMVETEFSVVRWKDEEKAKQFYQGMQPLHAEDIADAVLYCTTRPLHVDVAEIVIYPLAQASANHVNRKDAKSTSIF